jgi:hypothetical protein
VTAWRCCTSARSGRAASRSADCAVCSCARSLSRGYTLTFDYGYEAADLYAPFRRDGTLLCFYKQSAEQSKDPQIKKLLNQLAQAEKGHESMAGRLGDTQGAIDDYSAVIALEGAPKELVARALVNRGLRKGVLDE